MSLPPQNRQAGFDSSIQYLEKAPEVLSLNFFEPSPVNKLIFTITPSPWDIRLSKIAYSFGSMDLSLNGYVQLVISKVLNPDIYGTAEDQSNILFSKMGGVNLFTNGDSDFPENTVIGKNEAAYVYLIANAPAVANGGVLGRLALYYLPLYT
jgi:hypothetical protein